MSRKLKFTFLISISSSFLMYVIFIYLYSTNHSFYTSFSSLINVLYNQRGFDYKIKNIDPFYQYKKLNTPINNKSIIQYSFNKNDISHMDSTLHSFIYKNDKKCLLYENYIKDEQKKWINANLIWNKKKFKIKYKFHGQTLSPYLKGSFSTKNKLLNKSTTFNKGNVFYLISNYENTLFNIANDCLGELFSLISPKSELVLLKINERKIGNFYFSVEFDKHRLKKEFKIKKYSIFKTSDEWDRKNGFSHESDLDDNYFNVEIKSNSKNKPNHYKKFKKLLYHINNKRVDSIKTYIDLDYMARTMALMSLINQPHSFIGDNHKFLFDEKKNKFYPIWRIENEIQPIMCSIDDIDNSFFSNILGTEIKTLKIYKTLLTDNNFKYKRDSCLNDIILNKKAILNIIDSLYKKHAPLIIDKGEYHFNEKIKRYKSVLNINLNKIEQYLNYTKLFITYSYSDKNKYNVLNDSFIPVIFKLENNTYTIPPIKMVLNNNSFNFKYSFITLNLFEDEFNNGAFFNVLTKRKITNHNITINKIEN